MIQREQNLALQACAQWSGSAKPVCAADPPTPHTRRRGKASEGTN